MAPTDPTTWSLGIWLLWAIGTYYLVGFFIHWFRFRRLEKLVAAKDIGYAAAWNRGISGFPAAGYAKMMGLHKLETDGNGPPKATEQ
jgi:hypothetical protein